MNFNMTEETKKPEPKMYIKPGGIPYFTSDMASYPDEGGSLLHIEGTDIWYKGQLNIMPVLYSLDMIKRLLKLSLQFVGKNPIHILFVILNWKKLLNNFNNFSEIALRRHNIVLERYCVSARELIRTADKLLADKLDVLEVLMIIITFYEYDMAYRWRSQFALNQIDKNSFHKNPYEEVKRVMVEMNRREKDESIREKYRMLDKFLWILKIPQARKLAKAFVEEMDMTKIMFDDEDKKWLQLGREFDFTP